MKRWYVIQVYTGFEEVVKESIEKRIVAEDANELIGEILIPTGELAFFSSQGETKREKILPGYVLVQMEMVPEAYQLVMSISRVTRFLGGESPVPLSDKEVERIHGQMSGKLVVASEKNSFTEGSEVNISSGPFSGFVGIVDRVNEEHEKLTVMVSIFGRLTPVELGFDQVKR